LPAGSSDRGAKRNEEGARCPRASKTPRYMRAILGGYDELADAEEALGKE
jgi:hypothetical protein